MKKNNLFIALLAIVTVSILVAFATMNGQKFSNEKQSVVSKTTGVMIPTQEGKEVNAVSIESDESRFSVPKGSLDYFDHQTGLYFYYPKTWRTEKGHGYLLDIFSASSPYLNDQLREGVVKAQIQFRSNQAIKNKEQYVNALIEETEQDEEMNNPAVAVQRSNISDFMFGNGLMGLKISQGWAAEVSYVIPKKPDYSEVVTVLVWNFDPSIETILSTAYFKE